VRGSHSWVVSVRLLIEINSVMLYARCQLSIVTDEIPAQPTQKFFTKIVGDPGMAGMTHKNVFIDFI
jgi:hypothetical protein